MQLTPVREDSRILGYEAVSYKHDRFYGHVPERGNLFGISQHGEVA